MNYDFFFKYFDILMPNPVEKTKRIESYIEKHFPGAKSILDIGCGTGSILYNISNNFEKTGIDLSNSMLSIAKQKVKAAEFCQMNMMSFQFDRKFDVILCIYDTINHLLNFDEWEYFFSLVKLHLNENGLFIFDVNTVYGLNKLSVSKPQIQFFGKNNEHLFYMAVSKITDNIYNWTVKIFEHQNESSYLLMEENIYESCFNEILIGRSLRKKFKTVLIENNNRQKPSCFSERIWYICKV